MMEQHELLSLVFITGLSIPLVLFGVYWFAVDQSKRYVDKKIREVKYE